MYPWSENIKIQIEIGYYIMYFEWSVQPDFKVSILVTTSFVHLAGEKHCRIKMASAMTRTRTDWSGHERTNHEATAPAHHTLLLIQRLVIQRLMQTLSRFMYPKAAPEICNPRIPRRTTKTYKRPKAIFQVNWETIWIYLSLLWISITTHQVALLYITLYSVTKWRHHNPKTFLCILTHV